MAFSDELFIAHVDTTLLHHLHWPIVGLLARHYVEHLELRYYLDELLASGTWLSVRAVPHPTRRCPADGATTEFDIFGRPPSSAGEARHIHVRRPSHVAAARTTSVPHTVLPTLLA
ncbi:MAG TPA: hypothetical protein VKQ30_17600 [Ktedonobacterales bacterium]|nr:hypothetical protein [Ktedonobacterales bacterium]